MFSKVFILWKEDDDETILYIIQKREFCIIIRLLSCVNIFLIKKINNIRVEFAGSKDIFILL